MLAGRTASGLPAGGSVAFGASWAGAGIAFAAVAAPDFVEAVGVAGRISELDAVIGQHSVYLVRDRLDQPQARLDMADQRDQVRHDQAIAQALRQSC